MTALFGVDTRTAVTPEPLTAQKVLDALWAMDQRESTSLDCIIVSPSEWFHLWLSPPEQIDALLEAYHRD